MEVEQPKLFLFIFIFLKFFSASKTIDMFSEYFQFSFWPNEMKKYSVQLELSLCGHSSVEKCESVLDLAKSKCDSQLAVSELGILLRANSAAHLETLQNRLYN